MYQKKSNLNKSNKTNLIKAGKILLKIIRQNKSTFDWNNPNSPLNIKDLKIAEIYILQEIFKKETNINISNNNNSNQITLTECILFSTSKLLQNKNRVSINKIVQASWFTKAAMRLNICLLVNNGKLAIIPGKSRRPAYYALPTIILATRMDRTYTLNFTEKNSVQHRYTAKNKAFLLIVERVCIKKKFKY